MSEVVATTYLETPKPETEFYYSLRTVLRARGVELADSRGDTGTVLRILENTSGQRVLSVSARNTPQEYEVSCAVGFSLEADGASLIDTEFLVATRSYSHDATRVLRMSAEEQMSRDALAKEQDQRVLRLMVDRGGAAPYTATDVVPRA